SSRVTTPLKLTVTKHAGSLDPSFGNGGEANVTFTAGAFAPVAMAIQPDDRIIVVGAFDSVSGFETPERRLGVARLDGNGALDAAFGEAGLVTSRFSGKDAPQAVALGPDGNIVVLSVDEIENAIRLVRYTSTGVLDATFSGPRRDHDPRPVALAVRPNGN